jgi:hypothetical protein
MAQAGFPLFFDGDAVAVHNDSTTTAITAGDICRVTNADAFGTTLTVSSIAYAKGDIKVKAGHWSATGYKNIGGVAMTDIPADGYGTLALEGVFLNRADYAITAGDHIQFATTTAQRVARVHDLGTTLLLGWGHYEIGKALTGASATKYIIAWKMTF